VLADVPISLRFADVKSPCVWKALRLKRIGCISVTPACHQLLGSGFSDLAPSLLKEKRLDVGFLEVIEVAAVVITMSRFLMVADLDCEATVSTQSPDTRIA
jgi:hypothetical protein